MNDEELRLLQTQTIALERHTVLDSFSLIEDMINVTIYARYNLSYIDYFVQDILMSPKEGFGWKIDILEKMVQTSKVISDAEWKVLSNGLREMSGIRNYFAHTVLSSHKIDGGKTLHRGNRSIEHKVNLDEKVKLFQSKFSVCFEMIRKMNEFFEQDFHARQDALYEYLAEQHGNNEKTQNPPQVFS